MAAGGRPVEQSICADDAFPVPDASRMEEEGDSPEPHRYLELLYDEEVPVDVGDGYEVPRVFASNRLKGRCRTFSSSSVASEGSTVSYVPSAPLVETTTSDSSTYFGSRTAGLSSLQKLLVNGALPNGYRRELDAERLESAPANAS